MNFLKLFLFNILCVLAFSQPKIEWEKFLGTKKNEKAFDLFYTDDNNIILFYGISNFLTYTPCLSLCDFNGNELKKVELKKSFLLNNSSLLYDNGKIHLWAYSNFSSPNSTTINIYTTDTKLNTITSKSITIDSAVEIKNFIKTQNGYLITANRLYNEQYSIAIVIFLDSKFNVNKITPLKFDNNLNLVNKNIAKAVEIDNKIYVVGSISFNDNSYNDIWLACLNKNQIFYEKIITSSAGEMAVDMIDFENNLMILANSTTKGLGWFDIVLYHTDLDGNINWHKTFGGKKGDYGIKILNLSNNIYIAANSYSFTNGGSDVLIINVDKYGNLIWQYNYGTTNDEYVADIKMSLDNSLIVLGTAQNKGINKNDVWLFKIKESIRQQALNYVMANIAAWEQKGKYEKMEDYKQRVNEYTRAQKIYELTNEFFAKIGNPIFLKDIKTAQLDYDAENEVFQIKLTYFNPLYVPVPIKEAPNFEKNFQKIKFKNIVYNLTDKDKLEIYQATIYDSLANKYYFFDATKQVVFNNEVINPVFSPVEIPTQNTVIISEESDIDKNILPNGKKYPNRYALIIGNANYIKHGSDIVDIKFSINDARSFKNYCQNILGILPENIFYIEDANATYMRLYIDNFIKLIDAKSDNSEFFIYYSGHGAQNSNNESFLVPVGVKINYLDQFGIKLSELYRQIKPSGNKKAYIFLDACFSGGGKTGQLLINAKAGIYRPTRLENVNPNVLVFAASNEKEISQEYIPQKHGLFTYFLLQTIKETNGNITFGDLFLKTFDKVKTTALNPQNQLNDQTPTVIFHSSMQNNWKNWLVNP